MKGIFSLLVINSENYSSNRPKTADVTQNKIN